MRQREKRRWKWNIDGTAGRGDYYIAWELFSSKSSASNNSARRRSAFLCCAARPISVAFEYWWNEMINKIFVYKGRRLSLSPGLFMNVPPCCTSSSSYIIDIMKGRQRDKTYVHVRARMCIIETAHKKSTCFPDFPSPTGKHPTL